MKEYMIFLLFLALLVSGAIGYFAGAAILVLILWFVWVGIMAIWNSSKDKINKAIQDKKELVAMIKICPKLI